MTSVEPTLEELQRFAAGPTARRDRDEGGPASDGENDDDACMSYPGCVRVGVLMAGAVAAMLPASMRDAQKVTFGKGDRVIVRALLVRPVMRGS
jgi:hypothetical protein